MVKWCLHINLPAQERGIEATQGLKDQLAIPVVGTRIKSLISLYIPVRTNVRM